MCKKYNLLLLVLLFAFSFILSACGGNFASKYPLHDAAAQSKGTEVEALVKSGIPVDSRDSSGMTTLLVAAYSNNLKAAGVLINSGADVNVYDSSGLTPLLYSVWYCQLDMVKLLTEGGARADLKSTNGTTTLHYVSECYHKKPETALAITQIILEKGCDMSVVDEAGHTALWWAFEYQADDMVAALRKKGLMERYQPPGSLDESLRSKTRVTPPDGTYSIPSDRDAFYQLAVDDCNYLGNTYQKTRAPIPIKPLAMVIMAGSDAVSRHEQFNACMNKMGFHAAPK